MRPTANDRGYGLAWQKARAGYLAKHPLCVKCTAIGQDVRATVVDHVRPHKGDQRLFWDKTNWQALCVAHHNSTKQREERNGGAYGVTVDGRPIAPSHAWNKG